jgi:hypothetical protein
LVNKPLSAAVGVVVALVVCTMIWWVLGSRGNTGTSADGDGASGADESRPQQSRKKTRQADVAAEPPHIKTVLCKVVTREPGFFVLVDGEPARNDTGEKVTTPCEVDITPGNHRLTVVREKFRDYSEDVVISRGESFDFLPVY